MSKVVMLAVIVMSTIECLINGQKVTFLPSDEPQKMPKADAEEALERGLAKEAPKTTTAKRSSRSRSGSESDEGTSKENSADDGLGDSDLDIKDQVNV